MAHFAEIDSNNLVIRVLVIEQNMIDTGNWGTPSNWVQTSYNTRGGKHYNPETGEEDSGTPLRKNYAGVGFTYDADKDAFYLPKPFPSWSLNNTTCVWEAPVAYPDDDKPYEWDEENTQWVEVEIER